MALMLLLKPDMILFTDSTSLSATLSLSLPPSHRHNCPLCVCVYSSRFEINGQIGRQWLVRFKIMILFYASAVEKKVLVWDSLFAPFVMLLCTFAHFRDTISDGMKEKRKSFDNFLYLNYVSEFTRVAPRCSCVSPTVRNYDVSIGKLYRRLCMGKLGLPAWNFPLALYTWDFGLNCGVNTLIWFVRWANIHSFTLLADIDQRISFIIIDEWTCPHSPTIANTTLSSRLWLQFMPLLTAFD